MYQLGYCMLTPWVLFKNGKRFPVKRYSLRSKSMLEEVNYLRMTPWECSREDRYAKGITSRTNQLMLLCWQNWVVLPANMEAGKSLDAYGSMPGSTVTQADGKQAYTRCLHEKDARTKEWVGKYIDPVVQLVLALYGHPDSGGLYGKSIGSNDCLQSDSLPFTQNAGMFFLASEIKARGLCSWFMFSTWADPRKIWMDWSWFSIISTWTSPKRRTSSMKWSDNYPLRSLSAYVFNDSITDPFLVLQVYVYDR